MYRVGIYEGLVWVFPFTERQDAGKMAVRK
jgi:hypothetical protein